MSRIETVADGAILRVTLNRPEKKNALDQAMYHALADAFEHAAHDPEISVVLLRGGDGCFTAGNDLADFLASPSLCANDPAPRFLSALSQCPKIVIAALDGLAIGIGTTLLLHCDLVLATPASRLQLPFIHLGLVPEAASSLLLPRAIGHLRASELLLLGEPFSAQRGYELGLINRVIEPSIFAASVNEICKTIAGKSQSALLATKRLLKLGQGCDTGARMQSEFTAFAAQLETSEAKAAILSFFQPQGA